jgi:hypothetical protein
MELNGTHQLLVCADDVNVSAENATCVQKNTGALPETNKAVRIETNAEKLSTSLGLVTRMQGKIVMSL